MEVIKIPEIFTIEAAIELITTDPVFNKQNIPKTGLAAIMRDWMKSRTGTKAQRRFTVEQMCNALLVPTGKDHQNVSKTLGDFVRRGEVQVCQTTKRNRRQLKVRQFIYVGDWRKELKGRLNRKIFKAMYVSGNFAVTDIQKLTGLEDRCWIDKTVRQLKKDKYIKQISRRLCAHGSGAEAVYHIVDRDKFRLEVMR